jgi:predicted Zn-dependent peptidase
MPVTLQQKTLSNGLTIVAEIDSSAATAAAGFFVKTGARDEATPLMGVSHFLEHMMFKGTADISAEQLNQKFDEIGARNNAFTSNDMTCFYAHLLPEAFGSGLDLLGRMMRPALRESDFATEKGVIIEEIAMYEDNPFWLLYEASLEKHFASHPLSHRVLGTRESITNMKRDEMLAYFTSRYSADNTTVALAGNLDFAKACEQIEALCEGWQRTRVTRDNSEPKLAGGEFTLRNAKVNRGYVLALCRGPSLSDERRYAAGLISQILGAPDNSRMHWALIEPGLAEEAQSQADPQDGFGQFYVYASGDPDAIDEIWEITQRQMHELKASLTQADLDRLLPKAVTGATIAGERPHDRMHRLGRLFTSTREYIPLEEELAKLSRVTLDDLRECLTAFPLEAVTVGKLLPQTV